MEDPAFVSDEELWALRYRLRRELIEFARRRLGFKSSQSDFIAFDQLLNPDALTIGFARRFATYKRAPLIFDQFENVVKLINDRKQPINLFFAGKAHPRDDDGKRYIQRIIHLSKFSELKGTLVFIENYDVHVARQMVSGCDIWLNNPRRPLKRLARAVRRRDVTAASTSASWTDGGAKALTGRMALPSAVMTIRPRFEEQDKVDSANLYKTLTEQVIPEFYNRDERGLPRKMAAPDSPRDVHPCAPI